MTFERGELVIAIGLAGEQNWIIGIQFLPAGAAEPAAPWEPPPYADPAAFTETDVTLGDPPLAVTGMLSVPRPRPARKDTSRPSSCSPAPARTTRTRPSAATSR